LLKATYLADSEGLLRETRATGLFYFPGPVLWLLVFGILDYGAASARFNFPSIPFVTSAFDPGRAILGWSGLSAYLTIFVVGVSALLLLWLLVRYLRWISTVYAVTTTRVIVQSGIIGKTFDEIPIPQVRGVDVHQSPFQRMLGFGTVRVSSEGGATTSIGNEDWHGIPKPFEFQRLIEAATQSLARSRN
jgi:hypothetical protein